MNSISTGALMINGVFVHGKDFGRDMAVSNFFLREREGESRASISSMHWLYSRATRERDSTAISRNPNAGYDDEDSPAPGKW
jgi:hypothetical protein